MFNEYIDVSYEYYSTYYSIGKKLEELNSKTIMSLDFEVQSVYSLEERAEAKLLVKKHLDEMSSDDKRLSKVVARASGLSYPEITKVTHMILGLSEDKSIIMIINDSRTEQLVMDWIVQFKNKLIIHNSLFDIKLVFHRTGK